MSANWYISKLICTFALKKTNTMVQDIITYALVALAIIFLVKKFFFTKKKKCGGGPDCKCGG
jgi:hypothetical protein